MSISGAGGVGMGGGAAGMGGAAGIGGTAGATAGSPASSATAPGGAAQPGLPQNMQSLVNAMKDFSSAEILIALMLANAANGKDDEKSSGSAAAGFLAGLAMAGGLAQGGGDINLSVEVAGAQAPGAAGGAGGAGFGLNVSV
jgi:hypothetical protein